MTQTSNEIQKAEGRCVECNAAELFHDADSGMILCHVCVRVDQLRELRDLIAKAMICADRLDDKRYAAELEAVGDDVIDELADLGDEDAEAVRS